MTRHLRSGWLLSALVAGSVALILGFAAGRATAAPRSALESSPVEEAGFRAAQGPSEVPSTVEDDGSFSPTPTPSGVGETDIGTAIEDDGGGISSDGLAQGREGVIAQAIDLGADYLAIPIGPGHLVDVCGPAHCWRAVSTDAGPNHEMLVAGRIADVAIGHWLDICGLPAHRGTCEGSWHVVGAEVTPPATDR